MVRSTQSLLAIPNNNNTEDMSMMNEDTELGILELDVNLADVEKPPELPPGKYKGEVQDVQEQTSQKGNRYWAVKFVVAPENLPPQVSEHYEDGWIGYWNRQIVPKDGRDRRTLFNLRKFVEALGLNASTTSIDPNEWMGREAVLVVKHGKDQNGDMRAEIGSILPSDNAPAPARGRTQTKAEPEKAAPATKGRARR